MTRWYRSSTLSLLLLVGAFSSCISDETDTTRQAGTFLNTPLNLTEFNSEYDDYNSALPPNKYGFGPLIFSSRRDLKDRYNLVFKPFELVYDENTQQLSATTNVRSGLDVFTNMRPLENHVRAINGPYNVLGPLSLSFQMPQLNDPATGSGDGKYLTLFADDREGNLNIRFVHNAGGNKENVEGPFEVTFLNSSADDAYPTFYTGTTTALDWYRGQFREVYFTSNRSGNFDIYRVKLPATKSLLEVLKSEEQLPVEKVEELSSTADDKCPAILGNVMVFTSNRAGGEGGYDLYISRNVNGTWSTPENLGERINTASDEYRPILPWELQAQFNYNLMIFSSNRPGGKGGFDLYMVGLEEPRF
ncbi:PD40 domain-containing protein [Siphonobacter sp. BAB-5385]|uniref:PD40 domain-containing protein n=1 Tax=Siphonobacter sp. BAB-5385 TaxID=1864822 RepID=UPI00159566B8|nr:PD40 domain-containing protein [Siphonobacter sp. BAB-5385]